MGSFHGCRVPHAAMNISSSRDIQRVSQRLETGSHKKTKKYQSTEGQRTFWKGLSRGVVTDLDDGELEPTKGNWRWHDCLLNGWSQARRWLVVFSLMAVQLDTHQHRNEHFHKSGNVLELQRFKICLRTAFASPNSGCFSRTIRTFRPAVPWSMDFPIKPAEWRKSREQTRFCLDFAMVMQNCTHIVQTC
jgi:hypothetical protein